MNKLDEWLDALTDLFGCAFLLASLILLVAGLVKLVVVLWNAIF